MRIPPNDHNRKTFLLLPSGGLGVVSFPHLELVKVPVGYNLISRTDVVYSVRAGNQSPSAPFPLTIAKFPPDRRFNQTKKILTFA